MGGTKLEIFLPKHQHTPVFSTNAVNAVNFQVNFRNLHPSLQGLNLSYLQLIFEEDVNIDLDVIQNLIFVHYLHHLLHNYLLMYIIIYMVFYSKT